MAEQEAENNELRKRIAKKDNEIKDIRDTYNCQFNQNAFNNIRRLEIQNESLLNSVHATVPMALARSNNFSEEFYVAGAKWYNSNLNYV